MLGDLDVNERCPTCSEAYAESLIDEADDICPNCNGSGEGMYEGQRCWQCKGKGTA